MEERPSRDAEIVRGAPALSARATLRALHQRLVPPESDQGWTAYLWLVYLGFFFVAWFLRPVGPLEIILGAASIVLFLALYFSAFRRRGSAALWHVAAIAALAVAWSPVNPGASVWFIFAASFAYRVGPPRTAAVVVAAVVGLAAVTAWVFQPMLAFWLPGVFVSVIIGAANIFFGEQGRRNAELRLSQSEVRRLARVAERERIARDLHDVLGHTLSLIAVKSELAERLVARDPARAREEIASIGVTARRSLAEVRETISGFHEQSLDEALEQARLALRAADVELVLERDPGIALPRCSEAMLGLVIREAVTNIIRHARARTCTLSLRRSRAGEPGGEVVIEIRDDGRGGIRGGGSGVEGMRARLESIGGALDVVAGHGGHLVARLPVGEE
ncbi:histidine kinase [Wenzhouxiangella sp. XN24]|uniref:sensor histidine kinase n=1 Tax=Wenzhouxiangella sp. XN24 TaxID=2713569 RepID=UPI0013ED130E|nr:histidine kinase [Wenzhouxiangella sp. XN24]NGX16074.1 sensor histidine kinase [Wenzhouxiangella sp. XN24]